MTAATNLGLLSASEALPALVQALEELGAAGREALNGALEDADAGVRDCTCYVVEGGNAVAAVR